MFKLLEDNEAECLQKDKAIEVQKLMAKFTTTTDVHETKQMPSKQVIQSTTAHIGFYKTMTTVLPYLQTRYIVVV